LWLGVEAFDDLNEDPCIPLMSNKISAMDAVNKKRLDLALAQGAAMVQKAMAFSWDPDFTCTTHKHNRNLSEEIVQDAKRPIIFDCRFHSQQNRSVVTIGVNLGNSTFYVCIYVWEKYLILLNSNLIRLFKKLKTVSGYDRYTVDAYPFYEKSVHLCCIWGPVFS
jgi:hypothetical protein